MNEYSCNGQVTSACDGQGLSQFSPNTATHVQVQEAPLSSGIALHLANLQHHLLFLVIHCMCLTGSPEVTSRVNALCSEYWLKNGERIGDS